MNRSWIDAIAFIKEKMPKAHLWYSIEQGWCYITDRNGQRHRLDWDMKSHEIVQELERINSRVAVMEQ